MVGRGEVFVQINQAGESSGGTRIQTADAGR